MAIVKDILEMLNIIAPFAIAEDWDNSGLQAGNLYWEVKKIMIGLDVSLSLMNAARKQNCDLVLTHHPLMIYPEKSIDFNKMPGCVIEMAAQHRISIISVHTNLDKAEDGLNDYFATKIGLLQTRPFLQDRVLSYTGANDKPTGMGRIGTLDSEILLRHLVLKIKEILNLTYLRVTGSMDLPVSSIAICTGSGGSLVDKFLDSSVDLYITGDVKYHEARQVEQASKAIIDVGHFGSEHMVIDLVFEKLSQAFFNAGLKIKIERFKNEKDPFIIV